MENETPKRILIVGGGFAGLTVAMELERTLGRDPSVEVTLINRENFFLFTPMQFEKKIRVALDWTLDLIFPKDLVQFLDIRGPVVSRPEAHPSRKSKTVHPELPAPVP